MDVVQALLQHGANVNAATNKVREREREREREGEGGRQRGSEIKSTRARERGRLVYNITLCMFNYYKVLNPSPKNVTYMCVCVCVYICVCDSLSLSL